MEKPKKEKTVYLWTEKAGRILFGKGVVPGTQATFMGHAVTDKNILDNWLKKGFIVPAEKGE